MKNKLLYFFILLTQFSIAQDTLKKGIDYSKIYNSDIAKADIAKGKVQIIQQITSINGKKLKGPKLDCDSITRKYGFCYLDIQYNNQSDFQEAVNEYNFEVYNYLTEKIGKDWRQKLQADYDSISPYKFPYRLMPKKVADKPSSWKMKVKKEVSKNNAASLTIDVMDKKESIPFANVHIMGNHLDTTYQTNIDNSDNKFNWTWNSFKIKTNPGKIQISVSYVGYAPLLTDSIELNANTNTRVTVMMESNGFTGGITHIKCRCSLSDEELNQIRDEIIKAKYSENIEKLKIFRKHGKCWFEGWEI